MVNEYVVEPLVQMDEALTPLWALIKMIFRVSTASKSANGGYIRTVACGLRENITPIQCNINFG